MPTGIEGLDHSVKGIAPGELCIVGAETANGKSVFGQQWADYVSSRGVACAFISEEMSLLHLGQRAVEFLADDKHIAPDYKKFLLREVDQHYRDRAPIHVVESCGTIERVEEIVEGLVDDHQVGFVVVDYLQLLDKRGSINLYEKSTAVSKALKTMAVRLNIIVVALSQFSREVSRRGGDREPRLSDLRDSGQIEQDADMVIFLQWPWMVAQSGDKSDYIIYVAKFRHGNIGERRIETKFDATRHKIGATWISQFQSTPEHDSWDV